eukprot:TRINITY_DN2930_c0_g4_i1.p1 TRINITY_DN2930_c0_g4~~TRINITY_DN2930_c0_g4_i1.p1  ORF type:complete len:277 (+),score=49.40 TRINITY_DN2930_c0_g4_i1:638-1468(+)
MITKQIEDSRKETEHLISIVQINRTFKSSFYKYWYTKYAGVQLLKEELLRHVENVVRTYCKRNFDRIPDSLVKDFIQKLVYASQTEMKVPMMCKVMWMSADSLGGKEFCSMLNEFLRLDSWEIMSSVAYIARGINLSCVSPARDRCSTSPTLTSLRKVYRVSAVPKHEREFFEVNKLYRCPMYLATSSDLDITSTFIDRAKDIGPTRFEIDVDVSLYHGKLLKGGVESEHLFPPYSVFKVISTTWMDPSDPSPSLVRLLAQDNLAPMEELPVSTWH